MPESLTDAIKRLREEGAIVVEVRPSDNGALKAYAACVANGSVLTPTSDDRTVESIRSANVNVKLESPEARGCWDTPKSTCGPVGPGGSE